MKLAEALAERKALNRKASELKERFTAAVRVQEGDSPPEAPEALVAELDEALAALEAITVRINRTNTQARTAAGETLMEAIARRDRLQKLHGVLREGETTAVSRTGGYLSREVRYVTTVDVVALRRHCDQVAREYRDLDTQIQAAGWAVELTD